ncbi:unnamed protein product [Musa banksii]
MIPFIWYRRLRKGLADGLICPRQKGHLAFVQINSNSGWDFGCWVSLKESYFRSSYAASIYKISPKITGSC